MDAMLATLPYGVGGFCDARIISIAGPRPKKGTSRGTRDFLSHETNRRDFDLLQRGRPEVETRQQAILQGTRLDCCGAVSPLFIRSIAVHQAFGSLPNAHRAKGRYFAARSSLNVTRRRQFGCATVAQGKRSNKGTAEGNILCRAWNSLRMLRVSRRFAYLRTEVSKQFTGGDGSIMI